MRKKPRSHITKRAPILIIALIALIGAVTLQDFLSYDSLSQNAELLRGLRDSHYFLSSLAFIAAYVLIVAFSLPGATIATLTGGFLFGLFPGALYNVLGATIGATAIFIAAKAGFGADLAKKVEQSEGAGQKVLASLRENEWSALFIMRLVPVIPFFVANLLPAFAGTSLWRYVVSTNLGILPGAVVFTSIGSGLGIVIENGQQPDLSLFFEPHIIGPILGLAALSALPIVIKHLKGKPL